MPTYEISTPDGKTYEVDAPDEVGAQAAAAYLLSGGGPTAEAPSAAPAPRRADQVRADYEAMSVPRKMLTAADDVVRLLADGASFGYADKLSSYMSGTPLEQERALTQDARDRSGSAGTASEIVGAIMGPSKVNLAGKVGQAVPAVGKRILGRTALMAGEGAGYGALDAAGHDRDVGQGALVGAGLGAAGNVAAESLTGVGSKVAGALTKGPVIPTRQQTEDAARAAYDAADNAGVVFAPQAVDALRNRVTSELADIGYDPALQPGAAAALRRIEDLAGQNVTLKGLDTLRKVANNGFVTGNRSNNMAVGKIVAAIDGAIGSPAAGDVLMGNAQVGADALNEARGAWARMAKADAVERASAKAQTRASVSGSGGNIDNATRQELAKVRDRVGNFTPDEAAALTAAIEGTPMQNTLRWVGKMSPTGSAPGLGAAIGGITGSLAGGPGGTAAGLVAFPMLAAGAKRLSDRQTAQNVEDIIGIILAGGNKAAAQKQPNAVQNFLRDNRNTAARGIAAYGSDEQ